MLVIFRESFPFTESGIDELRKRFSDLTEELYLYSGTRVLPTSAISFGQALSSLSSCLRASRNTTGPGMDFEIPEELLPILKTVILWKRRRRATELDQFRANVYDPAILKSLEDQRAKLNGLTGERWFRNAVPLRIPRLSDFLSRREIAVAGTIEGQTLEDKFGILYAPSALQPVLSLLREQCEVRDVPLSVVFVDVDEFKKLNTRYGETFVDMNLLPQLMRRVARAAFGHGWAYRHGAGDEFVLLLPNSDAGQTLDILMRLRESLRRASYQGVEEHPTLSCGVCTISVDAFLTDHEIIGCAERAKNLAKERGRDRVVGYAGDAYDESSIINLLDSTQETPAPSAAS